MKVKKFLKKFDGNTLVRLMESTEDGGAKHVQTGCAKYVCKREYRNRKIDESKHICVCTHLDIYILPEEPSSKEKKQCESCYYNDKEDFICGMCRLFTDNDVRYQCWRPKDTKSIDEVGGAVKRSELGPPPKLDSIFHYKNSENSSPECNTCVFRYYSATELPCTICTDKRFMWQSYTENKKYKDSSNMGCHSCSTCYHDQFNNTSDDSPCWTCENCENWQPKEGGPVLDE